MRNAASALLSAATISTHLIGSAFGEPRFGRFGTRFRRSNLTSDQDIEGGQSSSSSNSLSSSSTLQDAVVAASVGTAKVAGANNVEKLGPQTSFGGTVVDLSSFFVTGSTPLSDLIGETTASSDDPLLFPTLVVTTSTPVVWPTPPSDVSTSSKGSLGTSSGVSLSASLSISSFGGSGPLVSTGLPDTMSSNSTSGVWTNSTTAATRSIKSETIFTSKSETIANSTAGACFTVPPEMAGTVISVVHTETITWWGDPADYTEPYEPVETPTPCSASSTQPNVMLSATTCNPQEPTCVVDAPNISKGASTPEAGVSAIGTWTYTYYLTDKNPAVSFVTDPVPGYGGDENGSVNNNKHETATQRSDGEVPNYGGTPAKETNPQPVLEPVKTDVVIEDRPTEVVINIVTVSNNPASPSTTIVTVGTDIFTVGPTTIEGVGATVTRLGSNIFIAAPTTSTINGLGVAVSRSVAIIDGITFEIGPSVSTQTVNGQTVAIGPNGIAVGGITVPAGRAAASTQVVVAGGEMLTVMDQSVVLEGMTYTYGPGTATITEVIDDDTIYIGPSGVVIDGITLGGPNADGSEATYTIVGGATISEIGASVVVVEGVTYTVGPGTGTTVTVVGGEALTIGPEGVAISGGQTLTYPFGPTMTTTLRPGNTDTAARASATSSDDEEDSSYTVGRRPDWSLALVSTCIAIGVGFFGYMI